MTSDISDLISLNKYISSTGFCSRREADKLIEQGRVSVNGKLTIDAIKISLHDSVEIDGEPLKKKKQPLYIAFNKPTGVTSTTDPKDRTNIIYFLNHPKRIFPIGRLDKDSDGLIFLTNDGDIVNKILRAANNHEKEYIVSVDKPVTPDFIQQMGAGVPILGTVTKKCFIRQEGNKRFRIILTQGLNRQIRRMCEHFGYKVMKLTRVRIMNVTLGDLPVGKWRYLSTGEVDTLNQLVSSSSKTEEASHKKDKAHRIKSSKKIANSTVEKSMPKAIKKEKKGQPPTTNSKKASGKATSKSQSEQTAGKKKSSTWKEFRKKSR